MSLWSFLRQPLSSKPNVAADIHMKAFLGDNLLCSIKLDIHSYLPAQLPMMLRCQTRCPEHHHLEHSHSQVLLYSEKAKTSQRERLISNSHTARVPQYL